MCGATYYACMLGLRGTTKSACCGICGDGDTHPSADRDRDMSCAQWAAANGPKAQ